MFIVPDSVRVKVVNESSMPNFVETVAFETPDGNIVLVVLNKNETETFAFAVGEQNVPNRLVRLIMEPKSIKTVIWQKKADDNKTAKANTNF
jgi:O-glycosyl hydrolase